MNSKHAFLVLSTFTLVSIAYGEREVFAPTKLAPTATAGTVQFGDGTVAAPSMTFKSDTDTGVFKATDNTLGITTGGTERMRITAAGDVGIGATPTNRLNLTYNGVSGVATVGPNSTSGNTALTLGTSSSGTYAERMRIDSAGRVGIGTNTPNSRLNVVGGSLASTGDGLSIAGNLINGRLFSAASGGNVESLHTYFDGKAVEISAGSSSTYISGIGIASRSYTGTASDAVTLYTRGVERFRVNGSDDHIVAGNGDTSATPAASTIRGTNASGTDIGGPNLTIQAGRGTGTGAGGAVVFQTSAAGTTGSSLNAATERMRIANNGLIGVGTASPEAGIHVVRSSVPNQLRIDNVTTNATTKDGYIGTSHYNNTSEEPVLSIRTQSNSAGENQVFIGGSSSNFNAATSVSLYTAANNTTTGGTERVRIKAGGQLRFVPLAAAPTVSVEDGDVYYNSTTNKLQVRAAGVWVDLH